MGLIIVSDLDGTLLDHRTYSFEAARPALRAMRGAGIPLVLATSKTAAEVAPLHAALDLGRTPAIVENGAGLFRPGQDDAPDGQPVSGIRAALSDLPPALRPLFRGFGEMSAGEIARHTGLTLTEARAARQRRFTEPGLWSGDAAALHSFRAALLEGGIHARRGGRFLTLSRGHSKADAVARLRSELGATRVVALGDAPNDLEMLMAADVGVIVRNDHGTPMVLPQGGAPHIRRTAEQGPTGWNRAVLDILDETETG